MADENVVVIMADALRADRLSCTGYRRDGKKLTPNIDRLAEQGRFFERAYATGPWTATSQPAFLTGEFCSNIGWPSKGTELPDDVDTLGTYFSENGYETRAYNMSLHIRADLGFDRGFDYYEDIPLKDKIELDFWHMEGMAWNLLYGQDDRTRYALKKIERWLSSRESKDPFFMFWNPVNPHNKYNAPRRFRKKFERPVEEGMDEETIDDIAGWGHCLEYMAGEADLTEDEMDVVKSRYDAEVAYLDYRVGQFIDFLKDRGLYEDTIIVFTSDHGENFGEYRRLLHHDVGLNEGLLRVPLIIQGGDINEATVEDPVSLIDLPNTLLKLAGYQPVDGIESQPALLPDEPDRDIVHAERDESFGELVERLQDRNPPEEITWYGKGRQCAIQGDDKLIAYSDGEVEAFDVSGEEQEPTELGKEIVENLRESIKEKLGPFGGKEGNINAKVEQRLQKLGYF